jgi:hypothetical protein
MKKLIIAVAALSASAGIAATPATDTAAPDAQTNARPAKDPNERICRNIPQTSTRLGRKQDCRTRAEWEAASQHTRDQMESRRGN